MKVDQMWTDIGPEKTALLKRHGFDIVAMKFVDQVNRGKQMHRRTLGFDHVRDTPLAPLRAELTRPAQQSKP
jgi:hypothetical protein